MTKYNLKPTPSPTRPFDLDHQMRLFMVEKRSVGLHPAAPSLPPPVPPRTPIYNTHKQLPSPPSDRKLFKLSKSSQRFTSSRSSPSLSTTITHYAPSGRAISRTELRSVPHSRRTPSSSSTSSDRSAATSPSHPSKLKTILDPWQRRRPRSLVDPPHDSFWSSLLSPDLPTPRPLTSPEASPLLPPPLRRLAAPSDLPRIAPRRITIESVSRPPRTAPPPPTPAKSRAQKERAKIPPKLNLPPLPTGTPVGFVAELVGSEVVAPVELMGDVPQLKSKVPMIQRVPVPRKKVKASKVRSAHVKKSPEGRELYAAMPLPAVPGSGPASPVPELSRGSSPVEVDEDGVVDWFEGLAWGEGGALAGSSKVPEEISVESRASVVDPEGACTVAETSFLSLSPCASPGTAALMSPVFPVSPRLASYYGARASFASSVGDAFRFDEEGGLSAVEEELDVDELYGFGAEEGASSLELEIEMMLGGYGSGVSDDWRDGIYSAGNSSPEEEMGEWDDGEGEEIVVGLDIGFEEVEGEWMRSGMERPKTRYLAARNSMLDGDAIFCLKGAENL